MLLIGLAPAAHGGTRTGRAFTGDKSGDFLFKCLFLTGISNSRISKNINDNLKLKSTYITNILNVFLQKINQKIVRNFEIIFKLF